MQPDRKNPKKKYRNAFVLKPGFKFHTLKNSCENIVFATDGISTDPLEIIEQLSYSLKNFDPDLDCIVPVGTTVSNLLMGFLISSCFAGKSITLAIYRPKQVRKSEENYSFVRVPINGLGHTSQ